MTLDTPAPKKRGRKPGTHAEKQATPTNGKKSSMSAATRKKLSRSIKAAWAAKRANGTAARARANEMRPVRRASFGEEMKAYSDIITVLGTLPPGSRAVVLDYAAQDRDDVDGRH